MAESSTIKERVAKLRKERLRRFIKSLIFISIISTASAVGFTFLNMKFVFFFMFLGLMPTIISILWDRKPGRFASKTVAAFNVTGLFPFIMAIATSGAPDSIAYNTMGQIESWLLIYGFAIFGWCVILLLPRITFIYLEIKSRYLIRKMEAFQAQLLAEWGEDVRK